MISQLQSPSVCVIDDEKEEYEPLLTALSRLGLGYRHFKGDSKSGLPPKPLKGLRIVFTDLHLSTQVGKDAASHTANVFSKLVSSETAPLIVVIWSKYQNDVLTIGPADDQPTEADLFKKTLLDAVPAFNERLVFLEMKKPKLKDRPSRKEWVRELEREIKKQLEGVSAFDALWAWEAFVRDAGLMVTARLTELALQSATEAGYGASLHERLKVALRLLVREQGGKACSAESAPRHFATVLSHSLLDLMEHTEKRDDMARHGKWLSDQANLPKSGSIGAGVNGFLLTSELAKKPQPFVPGTIYSLQDHGKFEALFCTNVSDLLADCYEGKPAKFDAWKQSFKPQPVLVEVSPACDVHQGKRKSALLLAGLLFPDGARGNVKRSDAIEILPTMSLRCPAPGFDAKKGFLVFFCRLKITMKPHREPRFLIPWFRLRELPTASLRNWHASHAARVGYVSL